MPDKTRSLPRWLRALPAIYLVAGLAWIVGSDIFIGWLFHDDLPSLKYAGTVKGVLFVVLSATLMYVVLAMRRADGGAGSIALESVELRRPLIAFALVGLGIAGAGYAAYLLQADHIRRRFDRELARFAEITAGEFALWHDGRVRSMQQAADSPFTPRAFAQWRARPSAEFEEMLRERLEAIRIDQGYAGVATLAPDGTNLIAVGEPIELSARVRAAVAHAVSSGTVVSDWIEIEHAGRAPDPGLDVLVALKDRDRVETGPVAIIVARSTLGSLLEVQPRMTDAPSSKVQYVRKDGDRVHVLRLPTTTESAKSRVLPLMHDDLAAVRAILGVADPAGAPDSDQQLEVAASRAVVGTPWYAVATVERSEIDREVRSLMFLVIGFSGLGFLATAALVLPWWRSVRANAGALVRRAESRAEEMATRLGWVTRHANDVILLIGQDGVILDANDRAEEAYGYAREELLGLDLFKLRSAAPEQHEAARTQFEAVKRGGSLVFETTHVRKDGSQFPVEVSSRQVELGDQRYVQSIVRDISDRRLAEHRLRESEAKYRLLFRANPHAMWVYDVETLRFLAVNDAAIDRYGYSESEFLAMSIADIRPAEDRPKLDSDVRQHADDVLQHAGIWRHLKKDGTPIDVEVTSHRINFGDRRARLVLANDVTARVRAERALRASEERHRSLFENASDGVVLLGPDCRILAVNAEYETLCGRARDELVGMDLALLFDECERPRLDRLKADMRDGRPPLPATWAHLRKDGSHFTGELRVRALPGGDRLATVRDLTEINTARRRIERQRDLYDLLSQCSQAILRLNDRSALLQEVTRLAVERGRFNFAWVGRVDADGEIVPIAKFGDDHGYIAGLRLRVGADAAGGEGPTGAALRTATPVVTNDFLNDPRTARWHDAARARGIRASAAFPIPTAGKPTELLMLYADEPGFFDADITATLGDMAADVAHALNAFQVRRDLQDSRLLLQSLIDASDALVYAFDLQGRAILLNDATLRATGGSRSAFIGHTREAIMAPDIARAHETNDRRVFETGRPLVAEEYNVDAGVERTYLSVKVPLKDIDGRIYAVGGISTDITELRRVQQELAEANARLEEKVAARTREAVEARDRAEAADRAKTQFLSSMSHELRSPLHAIIGFTSVLLDGLEGEMTPAQIEHLRVVNDASQHLLAIINDLLDMSRIEVGALALTMKAVPVEAVLRRVMQRFSLQASAKGLDFRLDAAAADVRVRGDERRIEQIVSNLVSNAIKYTPSGSVVISCQVVDDNLRIDVRDTGPGITPADQKRLFQRFTQLAPVKGALTDGTGLGLAIVAGLADAMNGSVIVESEPGKGSVFSLLLPLDVA